MFGFRLEHRPWRRRLGFFHLKGLRGFSRFVNIRDGKQAPHSSMFQKIYFDPPLMRNKESGGQIILDVIYTLNLLIR
ncbi:hypothetical protein HanIR_Chr11g0545331 [Helianthus annuus]|nr:hypothetical protein HanIR_Chr11g0545331 [Helianthus annuus]